MAIQVNGTTVIDNSRQLTNIASVDATTVAALGSAGVGGAPNYLVTPPDFTSPDATFSSNGTYSRGSTPADQLLWVYLVGGGGGATQNISSYITYGGIGGSYRFLVATAGTLDGATYTIGAGGAGNTGTNGNGTPSTITVDGTTYSTADNSNNKFTVLDGALPTGTTSTYIDIDIYIPSITDSGYEWTSGLSDAEKGRIFSGATAFDVYYDNSRQKDGPRGSLYAGDSGRSGPTSTAGSVPGGGGGTYYSGTKRAGAAGNIRIYEVGA